MKVPSVVTQESIFRFTVISMLSVLIFLVLFKDTNKTIDDVMIAAQKLGDILSKNNSTS